MNLNMYLPDGVFEDNFKFLRFALQINGLVSMIGTSVMKGLTYSSYVIISSSATTDSLIN